jgi:hypothetical protein
MQHQTLVKFNAKMHISKRQNIILFIPQASKSSWLHATTDIQRGARIKIKNCRRHKKFFGDRNVK